MRTGAKLAMLALVLTILAGAWLLAEYMAGRFTPAEAEQTETPEVVDLSAGFSRDITALSWSRDGQTVNLTYDGTAWVNGDNDACPIDSQAVQPLVQAVCAVSAAVVARDVEDMSPYGLDTPTLVIMAAAEDHITAYELGSVSENGGYYLRVADGSTVYEEDGTLAAVFGAGLEDILSLDALPGDIAQVTALSVTTEVESYTLTYDPELGLAQYDGRYSWFCSREEQENDPVDTQRTEALYRLITEWSLLSCVSWDEENKSVYGLEQPQATVTLTYQDTQGQTRQLSLAFGDYANGDVYVSLEGSPVVYLAPGSVLDGLMYPDWTAMTPLDACPLAWDEVTEAVVVLEGHTYDIVRYQETTLVEYQDERQSREVTENIYSASGWILDTDQMQMWLQALTALQGEGLTTTAVGRSQMFSVTLYRGQEQEPMALALYSYDSSQCLCVTGTGQTLLVSRETAESLTEQLTQMLVIE